MSDTSSVIIIIAPVCGGIAQSVANAFSREGWAATLLLYGSPPQSLLQRMANKFLTFDDTFKIEFNTLLRQHVLPSIKSLNPRALLVMKGSYLDCDISEALQDLQIPLISWTFDSLARCPEQIDITKVSKHVFYMDGVDGAMLQTPATWLPLGFDETLYHPKSSGSGKDIDILFVGTVSAIYSRRKRFLMDICASELGKTCRCAFIGSTGSLAGNMMLNLRFMRGSMEWIARRVDARNLGNYIANSRLCINIHQDDGGMPVNPLFFAIPGSGTCQMAENTSYLHQWLIPGREYVPFEDDTFLETLVHCFSNPVEYDSIRANGHETVLGHHTFRNRVRKIIATIRELEQ